MAASLAKSLAVQGRKTLLVELGGSRFFEFIYGERLGFEPKLLEKNLCLAIWEGEACLREYLQYLFKLSRLVDLFFDNRIMQALVHGAPGLKELALTGKITSRERRVGPELPFDEIVVDAYSTGHFLALLAAPPAMAEAISFGPMGAQSRGIQQVLSSEGCRYLVVVTPEELPLTEGHELAHAIQRQVGRSPLIVKNRCWPSVMPETPPANVPADFWETWKSRRDLQQHFDLSPFEVGGELPQIWSNDNRHIIDRLSLIWLEEWEHHGAH